MLFSKANLDRRVVHVHVLVVVVVVVGQASKPVCFKVIGSA